MLILYNIVFDNMYEINLGECKLSSDTKDKLLDNNYKVPLTNKKKLFFGILFIIMGIGYNMYGIHNIIIAFKQSCSNCYHTYPITNQTINSYECCSATACSCDNIYNVPTCSSLISNLTEGVCDNGYSCCNSGNVCACDNSCYLQCYQSVTYQRCIIKCDTCNTVTSIIDNSHPFIKDCGTNKICVDELYNKTIVTGYFTESDTFVLGGTYNNNYKMLKLVLYLDILCGWALILLGYCILK
jgi:hypothetical protein